MIHSCLSAFRRDRSRVEIDPLGFIETYLDTRRRSRAMRLTLNRSVAFAAIGLLVALVVSIAVFSTRLFLVDLDASILEPPAEVVPGV